MLVEGNWRNLITFYENQPWEKLQVLAARSQGVKTVGIQTTNFSRYHLSYALGKGEEERMPLPDRIGSSGSSAHQLLLDCGSPPAAIKQCGALRYGDLLQRAARNGPNGSARTGRTPVLVVLSIDPVLSRHLLEALGDAFPDGGGKEGLRFIIRPHPMYPVPGSWVRFPAELVPSASSTR
jgi:surface carbohydrate biosynthesis protein (TIGR04326 family)